MIVRSHKDALSIRSTIQLPTRLIRLTDSGKNLKEKTTNLRNQEGC